MISFSIFRRRIVAAGRYHRHYCSTSNSCYHLPRNLLYTHISNHHNSTSATLQERQLVTKDGSSDNTQNETTSKKSSDDYTVQGDDNSVQTSSNRNKVGLSEDYDEWIPPDRPLPGDRGQSHLFVNADVDQEDPEYFQDEEDNDNDADDDEEYEVFTEDEELQLLEIELEQLEEEEKRKQAKEQQLPDLSEVQTDWLKSRRSILGDSTDEEDTTTGVHLLTPSQALRKKRSLSDLPVIRHTLLTSKEIITCLSAMGGYDIKLILFRKDITGNFPMGPEVLGLIICSGPTCAQIRTLANTLVRQLRRRDLQEVGVVGAESGPEGSKDKDETWLVVDCFSYIVHIQDETTRKHLDLEKLWSGNDPLLQLDFNDEDAVDDYIAANPIPDEYFNRHNGNSSDGSTDISQTMSLLEKKRR